MIIKERIQNALDSVRQQLGKLRTMPKTRTNLWRIEMYRKQQAFLSQHLRRVR